MSVLDYCTAGARVAERALVQRPRLGHEERLVFVVGCPRSGTTFIGRAIGGLPGFVDFGEVTPWKAALPAGPSAAELRTILERIRRIGLAWGLRGVEQTPETAHVLDTALEAYPEALAVHVLRDGRDVVCSLLERGWLNADAEGREADRLAEFLGANVTSTHRAMDTFRDSSIGRWQRELTPEQLADVEAEAGSVLAELGYTRSGDLS